MKKHLNLYAEDVANGSTWQQICDSVGVSPNYTMLTIGYDVDDVTACNGDDETIQCQSCSEYVSIEDGWEYDEDDDEYIFCEYCGDTIYKD